MSSEPWIALQWLALIEHELLLFAGVFFLVGALDEFAVDVIWFWLRLTGRASTPRIPTKELAHRQLSGRAAVLIPTWKEDKVIEHTVAHALAAWPHKDLRIYVGCYGNDSATVESAMRGAGGDGRVRIVVHGQDGPTTKADCLNRLYGAMVQDEMRSGSQARMVVLHDAEDMVDPAALALLDHAIERAEFVQLPVLPLPQENSRWIGSHYCEEFAEAHGKAMVVRAALATGVPAAGVGCAFERGMLAEMASQRAGQQDGVAQDGVAGDVGPFDVGSLTEDYELGLRVALAGGRSRFLRVRGEDGRLVATRAYFPDCLGTAVQQKARWVHGIALQGWDRLGWNSGLGEWWMRLRDRRGPLSSLVLFCGYMLLILSAASFALSALGHKPAWEPSGLLLTLLALNLASFLWRAGMRFAFTAREYGWVEGLRAMLRIPVTNVIAIMAGRRALFAYVRTLLGSAPIWDKTEHSEHPINTASLQPALLKTSMLKVGQ